MDDYAGRILADRYRLPVHPSGEDRYDLAESLAFDTYSGQEVRVRQIPLPEVVEAEVLDADGLPEGYSSAYGRGGRRDGGEPTEPAVRRALEAAREAARLADHPRLDQVYDVFAEGGSLWVVGEAVPGRPLGDLLAERTLTPYRAAEVAADLLMAIRVLHGHGWVHRNITPRTVVVCDDGRVVLTGLAAGAAEEALCGYDPVPPETPPLDAPEPPGAEPETFGAETFGAEPEALGAGADARELGPGPGTVGAGHEAYGAGHGTSGADAYGSDARGYGSETSGSGASGSERYGAGASGAGAYEAGPRARGAELEASASAGALPAAGLPAPSPSSDGWSPNPVAPYWPAPAGSGPNGEPGRGASSGSAAAYRDGARAAAARVEEARAAQREAVQERGGDRPALPGARTPVEGVPAPQEQANPPGRIADPYGVQGRPSWHGATPRTGAPATWPAAPDSPPPPEPGSRPAVAPVPLQARQPLPAPAPLPPAAPPPAALPEAASPPELTSSAGSASLSGGPVPASGQGTPSAAGSASSATHAPSAPPRGPATPLAAERARQARMTVVGAVTERWAPEQAHPVHDHWQLAAPVGPATDLWALGALLFRAVQGHAPYPEDSTAELVQLVCSEPPAFAEECGPLRPVVESLLRQDPTDRPDIEELGGWLRSLVRSAPEPDAGAHLVALPPADPERLPMVRRKGELVRRRRDARRDSRRDAAASRARHRRAGADRTARAARAERVDHMDRVDRTEPRDHENSPRRLGRTLLTLVLLLLAGAVAYAMFFMPKAGEQAGGQDRSGNSFPADTKPTDDAGDSGEAEDPAGKKPTPSASPSKKPPAEPSGDTGGEVAEGFTLRKDPEGFQVAVASGWQRTPRNGRGQVVFSKGDFRLIVVPGRDSAEQYGRDPQVYQQEHEPELQPYRDSTWAGSGGLRRIEVGGKVMAEGEFTWTDDQGRKLFVRNLAILDGGRYHVVQLRGPEAEKDQVTRLFEQASTTYEYVR